MARTPIDLILLTGFLGAGKTTLLNGILSRLEGGDHGVLVNDFGPVAVDGGRLRVLPGGEGLEVYEVKDGSIFCSCKSADFVMGLKLFARLKPKQLFVEASGLADPRGMQKILTDNRLDGDFRLSQSIALIDATRTYKLAASLPVIREQIATADVLILNKCDVATDEDLAASQSLAAELNREAELIRTSYAAVDPVLLMKPGRIARAAGLLEECRLPGQGPQALFLESGRLPIESVEEFLSARQEELLRLKGWIREPDGMSWFFNDNSGRMVRESQKPPVGQDEGLVAIVKEGAAEEFAREWRELLAQPLARE